jgi:hypothetical protein
MYLEHRRLSEEAFVYNFFSEMESKSDFVSILDALNVGKKMKLVIHENSKHIKSPQFFVRIRLQI